MREGTGQHYLLPITRWARAEGLTVVKVEIVPWDVHEVLIGALAAGQAMEDCARAVQDGGENVLNSFGNASTAEEAFRVFWEDRHELGLRAAAVLAHNVEKVSDAAGEFIAMDRDMLG